MTAHDAPAEVARDASETPVVLAGRYRLERLVGRGGAGEVFEASDLAAGGRVAVKLLSGGPLAEGPRSRREVAALRLLRLPGVVTLLDDGTHDGRTFLVMDFVDGTAFPGARSGSWDAIAPAARGVLEILARVHAAGVVHRDLKPANVLVDAAGRPTILDFGLSYGPALGAAVTTAGSWVGTPQYLAPEQLLGEPAEARADLFAFGAMLYEALSGRLPHEASGLRDLVHSKLARPHVPLCRAAPSVPRNVGSVIDRMLARDPSDRPRTAGEVVHALFGIDRSEAAAFPRLGGDAQVVAVAAACRDRRSTDVTGVPGSGKTRTLDDAARILEGEGRDVRWALPGAAPFESLAAVIGDLDHIGASSIDEAATVVRSRVRDALAGGACVFADDFARLDPWSRDVLEDCRDAGAVVRVVPRSTSGALLVEPLGEGALCELFEGPDRILHLREDGARELWTRTGGVADRVVAEVGAWVRAGIAFWSGARLSVSRDAIDALRRGVATSDWVPPRSTGSGGSSAAGEDVLAWVALAWPDATRDLVAAASGEKPWRLDAEIGALLRADRVIALADGRLLPADSSTSLAAWDAPRRAEAHRRLAAALPPGASRRLAHLAAAGDTGPLVAEAIHVSHQLVLNGQPAEAAAVLFPALGAARESGEPDSEARVLEELVKAALSQGTVRAIDRVLYELGRVRPKSARIEALDRLATGALHASSGRGAESLTALRSIPDPADEDLRLWKWAQTARAAHGCGPDVESAVLADIERAVVASGSARARASFRGWMGHSLFARGRYEEAAGEFEAAAEGSERVPAKLSALIGAANALMEAGELGLALESARAAASLAASIRHAGYEARAAVYERSIRYRKAEALEPDPELIAAIARLGDRTIERQALLTEAAIEWRRGAMASAADLARRAAAAWEETGGREGGLLARTLAAYCSGRGIETVIADISNCRLERVRLQCTALAWHALPMECAKRVEFVPDAGSHVRLELLAPREIAELVGVTTRAR